MSAPTITLTVAGTKETIQLAPRRLIVAGYTGRNEAAVREHIEELAAIGIAPPPQVPMRYDLTPSLLTTESSLQVTGARTSGEVEPVLLRHRGRWYLGVGSDHTDRALERDDIGRSKAACPKPIGPVILALPHGVTEGSIDDAWDEATVESTVNGELYQSGQLSALRTPANLLSHLAEAIAEEDPDADVAVFAGTVPLIDGEFRHGHEWTLTLRFGKDTLTHHYSLA